MEQTVVFEVYSFNFRRKQEDLWRGARTAAAIAAFPAQLSNRFSRHHPDSLSSD
jgi:hypothetical protein